MGKEMIDYMCNPGRAHLLHSGVWGETFPDEASVLQ